MVYHWVIYHIKKWILSKNEENPRMEHMGSIHEFSLVGLKKLRYSKKRMGLVVFTELLYMVIFISPFLECACETAVWT